MQANCTNCGRADYLLESDGGLCALCADNRDYDDAQSYRAIARILGIDAADREAVERRVKELHDDPKRFAKRSPDTCECDHLCRAWNPATKRCESCGKKYERT